VRELVQPIVVGVEIRQAPTPLATRTDVNADDVAKRLVFANLLPHVVDSECGNGRTRSVVNGSGSVESWNSIEQGASVTVVDGDGMVRTEEPSYGVTDIVEIDTLIPVEIE
jgi:hypothetical protein